MEKFKAGMKNKQATLHISNYPKEEQVKKKTRSGISVTGTEKTEKILLPDLQTGLAPETHKCYVTGYFVDSFKLPSNFVIYFLYPNHYSSALWYLKADP